MADDLDGVSVSSSVPQYNPGDQYRIREADPDETGGGKDFYDGFMRKKKKDEKPGVAATETPSGAVVENPIPAVEQVIHDDVILSQRAKRLMEQTDAAVHGTKPAIPMPSEKPVPPTHPVRIQVQA